MAHEEGSLNDIRAVLGNDTAIKTAIKARDNTLEPRIGNAPPSQMPRRYLPAQSLASIGPGDVLEFGPRVHNPRQVLAYRNFRIFLTS